MNTISIPKDGTRLWRAFILPALAAAVPLSAALIAALLSGSPTSGVVGGVEDLSSASSRLLDSVGGLLPFGIAFGAGMVATVNPCGFPMLPAYLAMYVGSGDESDVPQSTLSRLGRALLVGGIVTSGFILLFGVAGIIIGAGARAFIDAIPWIGLGVGVLLAATGAWLLSGGKLYSGLAQRAASHIGGQNRVGARGYFLFGLAYATASLSCTLPIFMAVTGISLVSGSSVAAVGQFIVYGLGMGLVILLLTGALALFKGAFVGGLRKLLPHVQTISAAFMILAGAYIVFYWLTAGELLKKLA